MTGKQTLWAVVGVLVLVSVFGTGGFRQLMARLQEKRHLQHHLEDLREEHERLARELTWIKQDPAYTEYLIRKHLGYIKKGEVEYRFLKADSNKK